MPTPSPDVVIIGAGIIGGSIAWRLAQSGLRVTMVDAGAMGGEASWAGAGMLAPGGEMETRDVWSDLGTQSLALYPAFVDELERLSGISIDYQQCGAAEIVFSAEEWPIVERRAAAQRLMGIPSAPPISELRGRVAGLAGEPAGVLFYPQDALSQFQITEPDFFEHIERLGERFEFADLGEELYRFGYGKIEHIVNRFAEQLNFEHVGLEASAFALGASHVEIAQELHLDFLETGA